MIEVIKYVKAKVPEWIRLNRVIRDIPNQNDTTCLVGVIGGNTVTNLRQLIQASMAKEGLYCKCIRCREVGISLGKGKIIDSKSIKLCRIDYDASKGKEIFLSFEDVKNNILIGLLRLRIPSSQVVKEINFETAIIREIHTYGGSLKVGGKDKKL